MSLPALNDPRYLEKQYKDASNLEARIPLERREQFRQFVERELESHSGVFQVTKDAGLFVSVPKGE
jgi:hypothetical protein